MTPMLPTVPAIGAVVYPPDRSPEALLAGFAAELKRRGFRLGGLVQETHHSAAGKEMVLVELDSGHRLTLSQSLGPGSRACSLDLEAMAEASGAIRRAVADRADLVLVNKFSKVETTGRGFAAEMLSAMVEGVPLLTAVPGAYVEEWIDFTGGRADLLMPTEADLWRWWGAHHLYDDLALGVADGPARRVVVGLNWTLVEGPDGVGMAQTPERGTAGCRSMPGGGGLAGRSLRELAGLARSWDPFEVAVGIAACNAHYNRFDLPAADTNGLDAFPDPGRTVVVGAFPGIAERLPGAQVLEKNPEPGQYPADAAEWLLPGAESVIMTASTLVNRSAPRLLGLARKARVAVVGPGTPLSDRLFPYGVTVAAGLVATDPDGLARTVAEGGGPRDIKRHCRQAAIRRAEG